MESIVWKGTARTGMCTCRGRCREGGKRWPRRAIRPTTTKLRRLNRQRKKKEGESSGCREVSQHDAMRSAKPTGQPYSPMKGGRTHLAYKAHHAVDLDSELIVAAKFMPTRPTSDELPGVSRSRPSMSNPFAPFQTSRTSNRSGVAVGGPMTGPVTFPIW
jgi:hypothetical protein